MSTRPGLSRQFKLQVERDMRASASDIYRAWTEQFDHWFAAPGTLLMRAEINVPFFFETHFDDQRHPHYGRYLELVPDKLLELTWVTGDPGTKGAETVVRIELAAQAEGTHVTLSHAGFADEESRDGHADAWPQVLEILEKHLTTTTVPGAR